LQRTVRDANAVDFGIRIGLGVEVNVLTIEGPLNGVDVLLGQFGPFLRAPISKIINFRPSTAAAAI